MAATVVLVHGAWHGAWCWDLVVRRLDDAGVANVVVDNPSVMLLKSSLHDDADNVLQTLDEIDGPVVLVGHSYGGAVVTDAGVHPGVEHLDESHARRLAHPPSRRRRCSCRPAKRSCQKPRYRSIHADAWSSGPGARRQ